MTGPAIGKPRTAALTLALVVALGLPIAGPFREGWSKVATDFPNYYTAAVLTLQRQPLRNFYDWTWFQRRIHYAGIDHQLGGYVPFTPLTMLPTLPLAPLPPLRAKRVWMIFEVLCLAAALALLARLGELHPAAVVALALAAASALRTNFLFGQDYLLLLLLLIAAAWCLARGRPGAAGALLGVVFAIKLYTGPFLLYFAVRRQWRALWGMLASVGILAGAAMALFGYDGVHYFATQVLPRGIDGAVIDPYNPGFATMTAFLRQTFVGEPELNPHPLVDAPALFFWLRSCYVVGLLTTALFLVARRSCSEGRSFAWFLLVVFALSPGTASYHYILLLLPVALLLDRAAPVRSATLAILYVLVQLPLRPWDAWLFPKAWLLLALVGCAAVDRLPRLSHCAAIAVLVLAISVPEAWRRVREYRAETPQAAPHAVVVPGQNFASAPALAGNQMVYQTMAQGRYLLRLAAGGQIHDFPFDGDAFHPTLAQPAGPIYFELASRGHSRICAFRPSAPSTEEVVGPGMDPIEPAISPNGAVLAFIAGGSLYALENGKLAVVLASRDASTPAWFPDGRRMAFAEGPPGKRSIGVVSLSGGAAQTLVEGHDSFAPAVSPDGRMLAYVSEPGERQVWIRSLISGRSWRVSSGACNNDAPAWRADSRAIVIASDCRRGLGSPALYTIQVSDPVEGALFVGPDVAHD